MSVLPITLATAALCALFFFGLSLQVVLGRFKHRIAMGDGGNADMLSRIRTHANFAEYAPLCLILIGLLEAQGVDPRTVAGLGGLLILGRLLHAIGMPRPAPNPYRMFGMFLTWAVMIGAAVYGLVLVLA